MTLTDHQALALTAQDMAAPLAHLQALITEQPDHADRPAIVAAANAMLAAIATLDRIVGGDEERRRIVEAVENA